MYATASNMVSRFGETELVQASNRDDPGATSYNSDAVSRALEDASAEIDSYLGTRYDVPVDPVPDLLVTACCKLARHALNSWGATDRMIEDAKAIRAWLRDISTGKAALPGVSLSDSTDAPSAVVLASDQVFTDDVLAVMP